MIWLILGAIVAGVLIGIAWQIVKKDAATRADPQVRSRGAATQSAIRARDGGPGAAVAATPDLPLGGWTIVRLGTQGRQGVAGEYYRPAAIERVVAGRPVAWAGDWEDGLRVPAYLLREPSNPHDPNAVAVYLGDGGQGVHIGYLPRETAPRWQSVLRALEGAGRLASCPGMVYRDSRGDSYQVVLWLSEPDQAVMGNPEPAGAVFLDARRQCAVTGENKHQDVLAVYLLGPVWATLHPATVGSGRYAGQPTIEVRLDGRPVGALTAAQGERYTELLDAGDVVACEAGVYESARYREVRVYVPRVESLPDDLKYEERVEAASAPPVLPRPELSESDAGRYRGRHYTEWVEAVKQLKRDGELDEAAKLLLGLIGATEAESRATSTGVAPWYYEQLAIVYRKWGDLDAEIDVLERYERQRKAPGARPARLADRLESVKAMRDKQRQSNGAGEESQDGRE